jgi:hypothetical protein
MKAPEQFLTTTSLKAQREKTWRYVDRFIWALPAVRLQSTKSSR